MNSILYKKYLKLFSMLAAGSILTTAFSPFNLWPFAILSMSYLFWIWSGLSNLQDITKNAHFRETSILNTATPLTAKTHKTAFFYGWLFGLGFFGCSVSWVYISLSEFAGTPWWLSCLLTVLFINMLALFPAMTGYVLNRIFTPLHKLNYLLAFAVLWTFAEWARSHFLSGFPWGLLAYSQVNSPLAGFIPIVGERGVSFLVAILGGLLVYSLQQRKKQQVISICLLIVSFTLGLWLKSIQWTYPTGQKLTVTLIQAAIPQSLKWDPAVFEHTLATYTQLTKAHQNADLIIWPEAAMTAPFGDMVDYLSYWKNTLSKQGASLLLGIPDEPFPNIYYNALLVIGADHGEYRKRHLVPFGEYVFLPTISQYFIDLFHIPMSNFLPGKHHQALIQIKGANVAAYICYEIAFESLVLNDFPKSNLIINISDDSWFGHSLAAWQQFQIGQFRAIETGRYAIFATNDGITAIVDPKGHIMSALPRYQRQTLTDTVQIYEGNTPLVIMRDWILRKK